VFVPRPAGQWGTATVSALIDPDSPEAAIGT